MVDDQLVIPEPPEDAAEETADLETQRDDIISGVAGAKLDTLQRRVAWILNHFPETRDSDVALYIQYWKELEAEYVTGGSVRLQDIYRLTRPASLTRARAKLQNEFRLFLAKPEVRQRRGTLSDEEKKRALTQRPTFPLYTAFTDESGKTDDHLVVGAVWFVNGPEIVKVTREVERLAKEAGVKNELHFKEITDADLEYYKSVARLVVGLGATISFTSLSVERRGHKSIDQALATLHYHLLVRGIQHLNDSGRAPLPRSLSVFKDREDAGRDKLLMAEVEDRLRSASTGQFNSNLYIDRLAAVDSAETIPVQLADLYVSSVARVLNAKGKRNSARDAFADYLLGMLGTPVGPESLETLDDMTLHVAL